MNDVYSTTNKDLWAAAEVVLRGDVIGVNAYAVRKERFKTIVSSFQLRK